jgi:hypothetical protein
VKIVQARFALQSFRLCLSIYRITTINRSLIGLAARSEFSSLK